MKTTSKISMLIATLVIAITSAFLAAPSHAQDGGWNLTGDWAWSSGQVAHMQQSGSDVRITYANGGMDQARITGPNTLTLYTADGRVYQCEFWKTGDRKLGLMIIAGRYTLAYSYFTVN